MAEGLIIASVPVRVRAGSWTELPSLYFGARMRMKAGNAFTTENPASRKRVAQCEVWFLTGAEEAALRAATPPGAAYLVEGELPGATFSALVDLGDARAERRWEGGGQVLQRVASLRLEEA